MATMFSPGYKGDPELIASVVFISLLLLISGLASLPWDIYATFFIQIKHGISKQVNILHGAAIIPIVK